ncbi:MAG: hypothetical protein QG657_2138, partial [Acidobacteriota bacterium]|nr:hypothetical protein [Acidobacteriota bacterium]
MTREIEVR